MHCTYAHKHDCKHDFLAPFGSRLDILDIVSHTHTLIFTNFNLAVFSAWEKWILIVLLAVSLKNWVRDNN